MGGWRPFLASTSGKISVSVLLLLCIMTLIYSISALLAADDPALRQGLFIDAATGKPFRYTIQIGDKVPIAAPSGQRTGYPAEACYWTREGSWRAEPLPVLLNIYVGQPGPTFCPDCGRLVKPHAPPPAPGEAPPPTRAEYALQKNNGSDEE